MLAAFLHNLDPYAIRLWEGGPIRWYGLSYLAGFILGYATIRRVTAAGRSTLDTRRVSDFVVTLAIGIILGGRLGYVTLYQPHLLWTFGDRFPFWGLLAINQGGMSSHGGMLGAILAALYFSRRSPNPKPSWAHLLDLTAFATPLGLFFGRIANFVNGELFGRPCSPSLPWAVKFPQEMFNWDAHRLASLQPVVALLQPGHPPTPQAAYDLLPTILDQIRAGNAQVISLVEPLLTPRHPSQLYEALLEGLFLFLVLAVAWAKPRKPLTISGLFCATYGLVRIFVEFFREPDAHIASQEFAHFHITRGQWLSALLLAAGIVMTLIAVRRHTQPLGGWRKSIRADTYHQ